MTALLFAACGLFDENPQPIPLPTVGQVETVVPPEPTSEIVVPTTIPTEAVTAKPEATQTATTVPVVTNPDTPTPAAGSDNCVAPNPPEGVFFITYGVQPGDTLFTIGQSARPTMSVEQIAAANCITDVNRIEVGHQLLVWHSPTSGVDNPDVIPLELQPAINAWLSASAKGTLGEEGSVTYQFYAEQNANLMVADSSGSALVFDVHQLVRQNGRVSIGTVSTSERFFLNPEIRGRDFSIYGTSAYEITISGQPGAAYDMWLILGGIPHPTLEVPERIQFEPGASGTQISGETVRDQFGQGTIDRYIFSAAAGQEVSIDFGDAGITNVMIEDLNQTVILKTSLGSYTATLPADGDYIMTVWHTRGEVYGYGSYSFDLRIETPSVAPTFTPTPATSDVQRIQFEAGTSSTRLIGENESGTVDRYLFTASAGQRADFTIVGDIPEKQNVGVWLEDTAGNRLFNTYGTASSSYLLPYSGDYFLIAYHGGSHGYLAGPYEVNFGITNPPAPIGGWPAPEPISYLEGTDSARLVGQTETGSVDRYSFSGEAGKEVHLTLLSSANMGAWIEDAAGNQLMNQYGRTIGSMMLPETGNYVLTLYLGGSETYLGGSYDMNIYVEGAGSPGPQEPELITLNDGSVNMTGQLDDNGRKRYSLDQDSGRIMSIFINAESGGRFELTKAGSPVFGREFNVPLYEVGDIYKVLPGGGEYILEVYGYPNGSFELAIDSGVVPPIPFPGEPQRIELSSNGSPVKLSGTNDNGELDQFVFSATAGQTLSFEIDFIPDQMITRLNLLNSKKQPLIIVQTRSDGIIDTFEIPETGDYTLLVMEPSNGLNSYGDYSFSLTLSE